MKKIHRHLILYIFELIVLISGFVVILNLNFSFWKQFVVLVFLLVFYSLIGLLRHARDNDMHLRVVLEYIAISLIIALLFILLNITRI